MTAGRPRFLFVTGKLAEPALRRVVDELAPTAGFEPHVAVLPITVAALMTTNWVSRHLPPLPPNLDRVVLPGFCRGEVEEVTQAAGAPAVRGPLDLRDLPEFFGKKSKPPDYGKYDIDILAEVNHAPQKSLEAILTEARRYRASGADVIDLGCDPGPAWNGVGDAVRALKADGFRVSIDSFNPEEVESALAAGAELVLSVNGTNVEHAAAGSSRTPTSKWSRSRTRPATSIRSRARSMCSAPSASNTDSTRFWSRSDSGSRRRWPDTLKRGAGSPIRN